MQKRCESSRATTVAGGTRVVQPGAEETSLLSAVLRDGARPFLEVLSAGRRAAHAGCNTGNPNQTQNYCKSGQILEGPRDVVRSPS